jgi:hypothetical protein
MVKGTRAALRIQPRVRWFWKREPYQQPHWATTLVLPLVAGKKAGYYPRVVELHFHLLLWCFLRHNYPSSRVVAATTLVAHQQLP